MAKKVERKSYVCNASGVMNMSTRLLFEEIGRIVSTVSTTHVEQRGVPHFCSPPIRLKNKGGKRGIIGILHLHDK
jgi:hypothetical protein